MSDALDAVRTLLSGNWTAANTGSRTPKFLVMVDEADANFTRRFDLGIADLDLVVIYHVAYTERANALGAATKRTEDRVTIDIRTAKSRAQAKLMRDEVSRIIDSKVTAPGTGYNIIDSAITWTDLSNKMTRLWRYVFDVRIIALNASRGT